MLQVRRRLLQDRVAGRANQREQRKLQRPLVQLRCVADAKPRQRVEQRLQGDALGVEQQLLVAAQDPDLGEHSPFGVEQRCVGAAAGRDRGDVVGEQRIEEGDRVSAAQRELAALRAIELANGRGRRGVFALVGEVGLKRARHCLEDTPRASAFVGAAARGSRAILC